VNIPVLGINYASWARSNIMDESQVLPSRVKSFEGTDRNNRVIDEINKIGKYTPKP